MNFILSQRNKKAYVRLKFRSMNLIWELQKRQQERRSVKNILERIGISDAVRNGKPLVLMSNEEITKAILKWLVCKSVEGHTYEVRFCIQERQTVYITYIAKRRGMLLARRTKQKPELFRQPLYCWNSETNFNTLTIKELQRSVTRADAISHLTAAELQAALWWKDNNN